MKVIIKSLSLAFLFFSFSARAEDCGLLRVVKRDVKLKRQGQKKFRKARKNHKICISDIIKTGPDSRAKIVLPSTDEINISPDTEMVFETLDNKKVLLKVEYGRIRSQVNNKYQDDDESHYRVKTKTAVAGVRGTDFVTGYNPVTHETRIVTFSGVVAVGNSTNGIYRPDVQVRAGFFTGSGDNQKPHEPQKLTADQVQKMDRDTKVPDVNSSPSTGGAKKDSPKAGEVKGREHASKPPSREQRAPSSVSPSLDDVVQEIEQDVMGDTGDLGAEIDVDDLPDLPQIVDGGDVVNTPQLEQDNLIDNVIQNNKATVNFNIEVRN